jgi:hypothetical protein
MKIGDAALMQKLGDSAVEFGPFEQAPDRCLDPVGDGVTPPAGS